MYVCRREVGLVLSAFLRCARQQNQPVLLDSDFRRRHFDGADFFNGRQPVGGQCRSVASYRGRVPQRQAALTCRDQRNQPQKDRQSCFERKVEFHGAFYFACRVAAQEEQQKAVRSVRPENAVRKSRQQLLLTGFARFRRHSIDIFDSTHLTLISI